MASLDNLINDLVIANRILANEDIVDAYGHVSVRHPDRPDRFFLARSLAPEFITREDIIEFKHRRHAGEGREARGLSRALHPWRHLRVAAGRDGGRARPRRGHPAVRHRASGTPLTPRDPFRQLHRRRTCRCGTSPTISATPICSSPMWRRRSDLAKCMGRHNVALMRGHGFAARGALADRGGAHVGVSCRATRAR